MIYKMITKNYTKLELLVAWNKRPLVDKFIDNGLSGFYIQKWMNENGFQISAPTVYKYIELRNNAIKNGIPVEKMVVDKRHEKLSRKKPKIVKEIEAGNDPSQRGPLFNNPTNDDRMKKNFSVNHVKSETELIDLMLDKGYQELKRDKGLNSAVTKQIIDLLNLKHKFSNTGLTEYGKQVLRMEQEAMENVVSTVLMDYVSEEKYQEIVDRINEETAKVIKKIQDAQKE